MSKKLYTFLLWVLFFIIFSFQLAFTIVTIFEFDIGYLIGSLITTPIMVFLLIALARLQKDGRFKYVFTPHRYKKMFKASLASFNNPSEWMIKRYKKATKRLYFAYGQLIDDIPYNKRKWLFTSKECIEELKFIVNSMVKCIEDKTYSLGFCKLISESKYDDKQTLFNILFQSELKDEVRLIFDFLFVRNDFAFNDVVKIQEYVDYIKKQNDEIRKDFDSVIEGFKDDIISYANYLASCEVKYG